MSFNLTRREWLPWAGAGLLAGFAGIEQHKAGTQVPLTKSRIAAFKAPSYKEDFTAQILAGARACGLEVKDQKVFVHTQLESFSSNRSANADATVVASTVKALRQMGAAEVLVGAGPSWERDTVALAEAAGFRQTLPDFEKIFVDLNRDDVNAMEGFDQGILYLPLTALRADLIVSVAKMKTDAQVGVALSMENLTGLVPGSVYGWPKDEAFGSGVSRRNGVIVELARSFRRSFAIVDGVIGMEGNGPLEGMPKAAGVLVMGDNLTATDATCCRIMGIDPSRVGYLALSAGIGHIDSSHIEVYGEKPETVRTDFQLVEEHRILRLI